MKRKKLAIVTLKTIAGIGLGLTAAYGGLLAYANGRHLPYTNEQVSQCVGVAEHYEDNESLDINYIIGPENGSEMAVVSYLTESQLGLPIERTVFCYYNGLSSMRQATVSTYDNGEMIDSAKLDIRR